MQHSRKGLLERIKKRGINGVWLSGVISVIQWDSDAVLTADLALPSKWLCCLQEKRGQTKVWGLLFVRIRCFTLYSVAGIQSICADTVVDFQTVLSEVCFISIVGCPRWMVSLDLEMVNLIVCGG